MLFSVIVGAVESVSKGCAIYSLGFFLIFSATSSLYFEEALGPIIIPYPPDALAGLTTNFDKLSNTYFF